MQGSMTLLWLWKTWPCLEAKMWRELLATEGLVGGRLLEKLTFAGSTLHVPAVDPPHQTHDNIVSLDLLPSISVARLLIQFYVSGAESLRTELTMISDPQVGSHVVKLSNDTDYDNVLQCQLVVSMSLTIDTCAMFHFLTASIPCIHVPTLEADCAAWWHRPTGQPLNQDELQFLPLYCSCLVVGLHLLNGSGMTQLHYVEEERDRICRDVWRVGYAALQQSDWMQVHSIRSIQAIMCVSIWVPG